MKAWKRPFILGMILYLAMMLLFPALGSSQGGVTVSIDAPAEAGEGTDFIATINITDVTDFDAANYDITYDPRILEVTDVTDGSIGETVIPVDMWDFVPAETQGTIRVINNVPGLSGVSGSGYLAEIHLHVVGSAGNTSDVTLSNGVLSANTATEITATWVGDSVHINTADTALDAEFSASPLEGVAGVTEFNFTDETTGGKPPYTYQWDFDNDGAVDSTGASPTHVYANAGTYTVSLEVTDASGNTDIESKENYIMIIMAISGDVNGDGHVNDEDMMLVYDHFGERGTPGWIPEDVYRDGFITVLDMILIGQHWTE